MSLFNLGGDIVRFNGRGDAYSALVNSTREVQARVINTNTLAYELSIKWVLYIYL